MAPNIPNLKSELPQPPENMTTPYGYFKMFFDDEIFEMISLESNLYAHQKDGCVLNTTPKEIEQLVGILMTMGIVKMPNTRMYWSSHSRYSPVADVMSRNRFEQLRKYLHFTNNDDQKSSGHPEYDKLFKVRPLLNRLKEKMAELPPEERHSVDEQIIPFKGRSYLKQYLRNKPHKWGFKCFMRAGSSGLMYDFEIYTGKNTCEDVGLGFSGDIVMALTSSLPEEQNFKVYFDNWFSSLQLAIALKARGIFCVGTIRNDRMAKCPLLTEKELKENGRGSFDLTVEENENVALVRWFDRKAINFISTYVATDPVDTCKRWDHTEKEKRDIPCPQVVKEYNQFMGGVDLADMLLELYRIDIRSVKWYMRIFFWCIGVAVVNSWLLYRRHVLQKQEPCEYSLAMFQLAISAALRGAGVTPPRKRGRPNSSTPEAPSRKQMEIRPVDDIRYDKYGHWPEFLEKRGRCKLCTNGITMVNCKKCNVHLCFTGTKNCFYKFHNKL